jgi:hypothetical protein
MKSWLSVWVRVIAGLFETTQSSAPCGSARYPEGT